MHVFQFAFVHFFTKYGYGEVYFPQPESSSEEDSEASSETEEDEECRGDREEEEVRGMVTNTMRIN